MAIDNIIEEITPKADSQFRLKPCKVCKGENAKYVHYNARGERCDRRRGQEEGAERVAAVKISRENIEQEILGTATGGDAWKTVCPDCGHTVDKGNRVRHDAQAAWNQEVRNG